MFRFIDWVLALPEELEHQLWADVQQFEEEKRIEKGISRGQATLLGRQLTRRFGTLPEWAEARLNEAGPAQLES